MRELQGAKLLFGLWAANVQSRALGWVLSAVENQVILSEEANLMAESKRRKSKTFGMNQTKLRCLSIFVSIFMSSLKEETSKHFLRSSGPSLWAESRART